MIAAPCRKSGESGTAVTFKPTIEDSPIEIVTRHRHLGVVISEDLKWYHHVQEVIGKFSRRSGLLRWMAQDLPFEAASKLYLFYVRPLCKYASPVWHGPLRADQALFLERIQAGVARRLLSASRLTSKSSLLQLLGWPSLRRRREIASMTLFHSLVHTRPSPLSDTLFLSLVRFALTATIVNLIN